MLNLLKLIFMDFSKYSGFRWFLNPFKIGVSLSDPKMFVLCHDEGIDFFESIDDFTSNLNEFLKQHCKK